MSTIIALVGPIEFWWNTPEDPDRFNSPQAVAYRQWREVLRDYLVRKGYLVYSPHDAFKGAWDERAQKHNDFIIEIVDVVINMRPDGIPGRGTDHELILASVLGKPVIKAPPGRNLSDVYADLKIVEYVNANRS